MNQMNAFMIYNSKIIWTKTGNFWIQGPPTSIIMLTADQYKRLPYTANKSDNIAYITKCKYSYFSSKLTHLYFRKWCLGKKNQ